MSEAAAHLIDPTFVVPATVNWYFNLASALLLPLVGTFVTYRIVAPMLDKQDYKLSTDGTANSGAELTSVEKAGLKKAGIAVLIYLAVVALLVVPASGILRNPATGSIDPSPFLKGGQATCIVLGTELAAGHHNPYFDINEGVLTLGVELLAQVAYALTTA